MKLFNAILYAHTNKDSRLSVIDLGNGKKFWNSTMDSGWCDYQKARETIASHKFLENALKWLKVI